MPKYVSLLKWTEQGVKNVKDTVKRLREVEEGVEKAGGRITTILYTQGKFDLIAVYEWPDDEMANAWFLTLAKAGNVTSTTSRAYTPDEMERIISKMP